MFLFDRSSFPETALLAVAGLVFASPVLAGQGYASLGAAALLGALLAAFLGVAFGIRWSRRLRRLADVARRGEKYRVLTDRANDAIVVARSADARIIEASHAAERLYGYTQEEFRHLTVYDLRTPETREELKKILATDAPSGIVVESVGLRKDGSTFAFEASTRSVELDGDRVRISVIRDVTERTAQERRMLLLNRLLRTISEINELIVRERDRGRLLDGICRLAVDEGRFRMAWIGLLEAGGREIVPVASAGRVDGYLDSVRIRIDDSPLGRSPKGGALREGQPFVCNDADNDERLSEWRARGLERGYRSSAAAPIRIGAKVVGAISVYDSEKGIFADEVVGLLEEVAGDIGFALSAIEAEESRRRMEDELRSSEERFRGMVNALPFPIVLTRSSDGSVLYANPAGMAATGLPATGMAVERARDYYLDPADHASVLEELRHTGVVREREVRLIRKSRDPFWALISCVTTTYGGEQAVLSSIIDNSAQKATLARVTLLNRLLRTISEINELIVREKDPGRLLSEACRITVERGEFRMAWIGRADEVTKAIRPLAWAGLEEGYLSAVQVRTDDTPYGRGPGGQAIRQGRPDLVQDTEIEERMAPAREEFRRRGYRSIGAFPFETGALRNAFIVYATEPNVFVPEVANLLEELANDIAFALSAIEAEERRRIAEAKLQESEARFSAFMDELPAAAFIRDGDSRTLYANQVMRDFVGKDIVGRRTDDYFDAEIARPRMEEDRRALLEGPSVYRQELQNAEGHLRVFQTHKFPIHLAGRPPLVGGIAIDVTEQTRSEQEVRRLNEELEERVRQRTAELQAANRELEAFSYSVSHDLRAPLRAIDGYSSMVQRSYQDRLDDEGRRLLDVIRSSTVRMAQLIDDLLLLSRTGRHEIRSARLEMGELVERVWQELVAQSPDPPAELRLQRLPPAHGDPALVTQVVTNLLSNALKFSSRRERRIVEVGSTTEDGETSYFIRDNGAGFDMKYADKLFGVFQRLHGQTEFPGTGVGLAIVQRIIRRLGGRVWAEGKPGAGATFRFTLPRDGD